MFDLGSGCKLRRARLPARCRFPAHRRSAPGHRKLLDGLGRGPAIRRCSVRPEQARQPARLGDRKTPEADAGPRAQQDAGSPALLRVPRILPEQRRRVLRQLLRLLPARGLPPALRHVHREGLARNDEIDRLRHAATHALFERRDVIIVASVPASTAWVPPSTTARPSSASGWAASTGATRCCATLSTSSTSATTRPSAAPGSASAATRSSSSPRPRTPSSGSSSSATRSSGSPSSTR